MTLRLRLQEALDNIFPHLLILLCSLGAARSGKSSDATVTEVIERTPDRILVRTRRLNQ